MEYLHDCGYLSMLWECGETLAAFAISTGIIHKVNAFVAPKIIGGKRAPSLVGELKMVEMTQALNLLDVCFEQSEVQQLIGTPGIHSCRDENLKIQDFSVDIRRVKVQHKSTLEMQVTFRKAVDTLEDKGQWNLAYPGCRHHLPLEIHTSGHFLNLSTKDSLEA
ncbi:hypothetical protein Ancab_024502 [Ancistrocladus abbreviatus]